MDQHDIDRGMVEGASGAAGIAQTWSANADHTRLMGMVEGAQPKNFSGSRVVRDALATTDARGSHDMGCRWSQGAGFAAGESGKCYINVNLCFPDVFPFCFGIGRRILAAACYRIRRYILLLRSSSSLSTRPRRAMERMVPSESKQGAGLSETYANIILTHHATTLPVQSSWCGAGTTVSDRGSDPIPSKEDYCSSDGLQLCISGRLYLSIYLFILFPLLLSSLGFLHSSVSLLLPPWSLIYLINQPAAPAGSAALTPAPRLLDLLLWGDQEQSADHTA
ncbi:hypothetical protein EJB05_06142, partial [Eragrostis curvula]